MLVTFEDWFLQEGIECRAEELDHVPVPPKNVASTGGCGFDFCFKERWDDGFSCGFLVCCVSCHYLNRVLIDGVWVRE